MFAGFEFEAPGIQFARGDNFLRMIKVKRAAGERLTIQQEFELTIVAGLGADELQLVGALLFNRERQHKDIAHLAAGEPEVIITTPATRLEAAHTLPAHLAASLRDHLHGFTFDGAVDAPDTRLHGCGGRAIRRLQVSDEVNRLGLGERIKQTLRHQRYGEHIALLDLALRDCELAPAGQYHTERLRILKLHDAADGGAVLEFKDIQFIALPDNRIRIEDVIEQVIELAQIRTRETRSNLIADITERVAQPARLDVELTASLIIGLAEHVRLQNRLPLSLVLGEISLGHINDSDDLGQQAIHGLITERFQLAHHNRTEQHPVDAAGGGRLHQATPTDDGGRERGNGIRFFGRRKSGELCQHARGRLVIPNGGQRLKNQTTEIGRKILTQGGHRHRCGETIAGGHEHRKGTLASGHGSLHVAQLGTIKSPAGGVAREGVEFIDIGHRLRRSVLAERRSDFGPASGSLESARLANSVDHATDDLGPAGGVRRLDGKGEHATAGHFVTR